MSYPSASPPTHHGRHAAIAIVVAFLALYFLAPWFLLWPVWTAATRGYITLADANWVSANVFAPIWWTQSHSQLYAEILESERKLCRLLFGFPR